MLMVSSALKNNRLGQSFLVPRRAIPADQRIPPHHDRASRSCLDHLHSSKPRIDIIHVIVFPTVVHILFLVFRMIIE